VSGGGAVEGGLVAVGAGAQGSVGFGGFVNTNNGSPSAGGFASGGAWAGGPGWGTSAPRQLFATGLIPDPTINQYAVTADGRKFLVLEPRKGFNESYSVVLNWPATVK
jgi:hypothetical protein